MFNILYVTGSRAEFGIMKPLLVKLNQTENVTLDIVVTGTHLDKRYGMTVTDIEATGLNIIERIKLDNSGMSSDIVKSLALITSKLAEILSNKKYDLTLILGDRQEMLPVANASLLFNIPIVHIHGGEITEGNYDDSIRHALTKMSSIHLTSCDAYSNRVIQMGEQKDSVFNIGSMSVEEILKMDLPSYEEISHKYNVPFGSKNYYVVLYHPVTLNSKEKTLDELKNFVESLKESKENYVIIGSNADTNSNYIRESLLNLQSENSQFMQIESLIQRDYFSLIKNSLGLVGNSSSGIIEVNSLGVPVLNIGDRQKGRIHGSGVESIGTSKQEIKDGLIKIKTIYNFINPYEQSNSVNKAYGIIIEILTKGVKRKKFYDIPRK